MPQTFLKWHAPTANNIFRQLRNLRYTVFQCTSRLIMLGALLLARRAFSASKTSTADYEQSNTCTTPQGRYLYTHVCPPIPAAVLSSLEEADTINARALAANGLSRFTADLPAVRLEGPLPEEAHILGISHQFLLSTGRKGIGLAERAPLLHLFLTSRLPIPPDIPLI